MQTIIAAFDDRATAQQAIDGLIAQGFQHDNVHLQHGYDADMSATDEATDTHRSFFGAVEDFFTHIFSSESAGHAGHYSEAIRRGSSVVVVDAVDDAQLEQARSVLGRFNPVDIDERVSEWKSTGWNGYDAEAAPMTGAAYGAAATGNSGASTLRGTDLAADTKTVMPVVEEELVVGKRTVEGGALRVVKRVTETPVSQLVNLRQERATIERRPVDRAATEADFSNFKEGTIEVREMQEEAVVGKTARVVEEVVVGKEVTERAETVSDTVRRTDVDVERVAGGRTHASALESADTATTGIGPVGTLGTPSGKSTTLGDL